MKKSVLIMSVVALFILGCSTSGDYPNSEDAPNTEAKLMTLKEIRNYMARKVSDGSLSKNGENNGVVIMQGAGEIFIGTTVEDYVVLFFGYDYENEQFNSLIDVKIFRDLEEFPEDSRAQFTINSSDFVMEIYDLNFLINVGPEWADGALLYSNQCNRDLNGRLHVGVTGPYVIVEDIFGNPVPAPARDENGLIFDTVNVIQVNAKVDDAHSWEGSFDNFINNILTCEADPSEIVEKHVKVTSITKNNGGTNLKIHGL